MNQQEAPRTVTTQHKAEAIQPHLSAKAPVSRADESSTGFGALARRIADWTTKGIFSALVLVAGLGFGRQVVDWWHSGDAPQVATVVTEAPLDLSDAAGPVEIAVGELPLRFGRQTVVGDQAQAIEALEAAGRAGLATASPLSQVADADEQYLLDRLAQLKPVEARSQGGETVGPDAWLYEPSPGMPLIVGTRRLNTHSSEAAPDATAWETRVVLWGLAAPAGERLWTLYLLQAERSRADDQQQEGLPLPPDCRRLMAFRDQQGAETAVFQGSGECDHYRRFYAAWLTEHGQKAAARWRRSGDGGWQVMVVLDGSQTAAAERSLWIHLSPAPLGGCTGFVFISGRGT